MLSKVRFSLLLVLGLAVVITGCSNDDDSNPVAPVTGQANVRVLHTSYNAPAVDVWVDGSTAITDLDYGESSGYAKLDAGKYNVQVTPTGAINPVVIDADLTLAANIEYTIIAADAVEMITPIVVEDSRAVNSAKVKIRFAHMAPDAPAVDIKLNDGNGAVVFENKSFKSVSDYIEVDAGTYTFAVTAHGSTNEVVVFDPVTVQNGSVLTAVAHGTLAANDGYDFGTRVFVDNGDGNSYVDLTTIGSANVMVVHASPDAPGVDLLVDDAVSGTNLTFPNNTGYLAVSAGMHNIKVNVTGTAATVIEADLDLMKDVNYSVFAVDSVANIGALVIEDDLTAPAGGFAHVRFIHLSPNAPAVDITLTDGTVVFGDRSFKEYTPFTPLAAGTYGLQVRLQGTSTVVLELGNITVADGMIYTVFAKGFVGGVGDQALNAEIIVNN